MFRAVAGAVDRASLPDDAVLLSLTELRRRTQQILLERRLVSDEIVGRVEPESGAGVAVCPRETLSVMINEETT